MNEKIFEALKDLPKTYNVHTIPDAWYTPHSLLRAVGSEDYKEYPQVPCIRVRLPGGMLELYPQEDETIQLKCYCCFGGNPDQGTVALDKLAEKIESLKEHYCPPWPG